jgi:DNA-binding transcriptional MerR regulator
MKPAPSIIAGSLAANAALFGALAWQPSFAPPAFRDFFTRHFHVADATAGAAPDASAARGAAKARPLWAVLKSDDLPTLIARLRAAGFPPSVIREIVRLQVSARYNARLAALMEPDPSLPFWKVSPYVWNDPKRQEEINQLQRERAKVIRDLLADDSLTTGDVTAAQRRQFGNLAPPKIDAVQRIEDDYNEMISQVRSAMNGVTLPEDREKLALLNREKQADLAGVLTPEELTDYNVRSSPITNMLRNQLGLFDASEGEFRAIFQEQQTLNDKFPPSIGGGIASMGDYEQRQAVQKDLEVQLKATLGDERYAEYSRDTNRDFQQLSRLVQSDNLPPATAVQAFNVRDQVAQASNQIYDDATLSADQKRTALQTLAQDTRAQLLSTLGPTSGPAYVKTADNWLNNVERGSAVTFTTTGGGSTMISTMNGTTAMVSMSGISPTYRRLPPPAPRP